MRKIKCDPTKFIRRADLPVGQRPEPPGPPEQEFTMEVLPNGYARMVPIKQSTLPDFPSIPDLTVDEVAEALEEAHANDELKDALNRLAWQMYALQGYQASEGFDFSTSQHPQEQLMWNLAVTAYEFFQDEGLP